MCQPFSSQFNQPSGIGAFANSSLDDATHFVFIADRDNHVIRGMSAVCTFRCENGGRCLGPDFCQCKEGWTGLDCTKPVCIRSCFSREVCVAPDTCECIPGWTGDDCRQATCVQNCENSGYCSAPDTCTCSHGWFDPNCTTPVCEQTCGNGGEHAKCKSKNHTNYNGRDIHQPLSIILTQSGHSLLKHVVMEVTARNLTAARVQVIGLELTAEHRCVNKHAIMGDGVLLQILACVPLTGLVMTATFRCATKGFLFHFMSCQKTL